MEPAVVPRAQQRSSRMEKGTARCACAFCCFQLLTSVHFLRCFQIASPPRDCRRPSRIAAGCTPLQAAPPAVADRRHNIHRRRKQNVASRNTRAPHRPPAAAVSPAASLPLPQPLLPVLQHATDEVCNQYRRDALCAPAFSFRCSLRHNQPRRALRSGLSTRSTPLRHDRRSGRSLHTHSMVCRCFLLSAQLHNTETHSEMKFADEVCRSKPSTVPATLASKLLLLHHAPRQQNQDSKVSVSFESSRGRRLLLEEA